MNENMNMNGRKKRSILPNKSEFVQKISNFTLPNEFTKPEMIHNFYDTFIDCKSKNFDEKMDSNCQEDFIIIGWKNMRKLLITNQNDRCLVQSENNITPLSNLTGDILR